MKRFSQCLSVILGILLSANFCSGDGFIIIQNPPPPMVRGHFAFAPLEVAYHRVTVRVNELLATTTVDQEFYNQNPQDLESAYLFPLPAGAHISRSGEPSRTRHAPRDEYSWGAKTIWSRFSRPLHRVRLGSPDLLTNKFSGWTRSLHESRSTISALIPAKSSRR